MATLTIHAPAGADMLHADGGAGSDKNNRQRRTSYAPRSVLAKLGAARRAVRSRSGRTRAVRRAGGSWLCIRTMKCSAPAG